MELDQIKVTQKTVEQYIDAVDYSNSDIYTPSKFALEFVHFIKLVNGEDGEENLTPVIHLKMLDMIPGPTKNIANMIFRGSGKTTVFGEYMWLYLATFGSIPGFGDVPLALYVSDSMDNGVKNMRLNTEYRWQHSEFLQEYVPKATFTDHKWKFENIDGHQLIVQGYGIKTGVRGKKEQGQRPVFALLDDLIDEADARSDTVINAVDGVVYQALKYALHPTKRKILWNGTPYNSKDPLYKAIESGAWKSTVFPVCENFPCTRKEFRGAWEDRFTFDAISDLYKEAVLTGTTAGFQQEMMLRIMSDEDRLILDSDIMWYKFSSIRDNLGKFNIYITTDFATSKKKGSDFSVISVWALNNEGSWFWIDGLVKKQLMNKNIDDLFDFVQKYKPQTVGIEISAQQNAFISWVQDEMLRRNIYFTLASDGNNNQPGIRPVTEKFARFTSLVVPLFKAKRIWFPKEKEQDPEIVEAMTEIRLASHSGFKSKFDDFADTISMLPCLKAWRPNQESIMINKNANNRAEDLWEVEEEDIDNRITSYIV